MTEPDLAPALETVGLAKSYGIHPALEPLDLVIDAGHCGTEMTTVIDLSDMPPKLIRAGCGPLGPLGLE